MKRNDRIKRILRESKTPRKTLSYGIYSSHSGDGLCPPWETDEGGEMLMRLSEDGLCAKGHSGECCTFATKGLASLVLAWFAHRNESIFFGIRDRLYEVPKSEWCRKMFDKVLDTGRYDEDAGPYYVKALPVNKRGETICSDALDLPSSYHDGIERVRTHNW